MKKSIYLILFTCLPFLYSYSQNTITVTMKDGKVTIPKKSADFKYTAPVLIRFAEKTFNGKTVQVLSENNEESKIIEEGKFGEDLSKKTENGSSFFEIKIEEDLTIDLKDNTTIIKTGSLFFKIDNGALVGPINFAIDSISKISGNEDFNTQYATGAILLDAQKLNDLKNSMGKSDSLQQLFLFILKKYKISNASSTNNLFIKSALEDAYNNNIDAKFKQGGAQSGGGIFSSAISSVGGLDVTTIADGFAKFIVKRAKQELSIAFFDRLKRELEKYPDLKTVFPTTYNILQGIDQQIYNYSSFIGNLREAFRFDLQTFDENLPGIIDNHPKFFSKKNNYELGIALRTGCHISTSLRHDMHPGDILDTYPTNPFDSIPDGAKEDASKLKALKGSIQSLQLFSESLKESDTTKHAYWVSIDKIRQVVGDKTAFKIYIGLMLQVAHNKYDDIRFSDSESLYTMLNTTMVVGDFDKDYAAYKQYILTFGSKVNELNKMIKEYEKPTIDSLKIEQYAKYFKASIQFLQYSIQVTNLPHIKEITVLGNLDRKTEKYFNIGYKTADLTTSINRKRYSETVNHLIIIYNEIITKPAANTAITSSSKIDLTKTEKEALLDNLISANSADPNATVASVVNSSRSVAKAIQDKDVEADNSNKVLNSLVKYGAFMANMINAQNSDEVESTIEAAVLPVGSSIVKRESPFNVSLNAYAGFFYGHESIKGVKDKLTFNSYGVTAPIGIAISRGHSVCFLGTGKNGWKKDKGGWSTSLFLSLIDLGAVAAYRVGNDSVAQVPTIQLKDIFSPGAFLSIGIPKTPLSFNFGAQFGPNLRKVTGTKNDYSDKTYARLSASLCVDIPLFNLYTKSK